MSHTRDALGRKVRDSFVEAAAELGIEHPLTPAWLDLPDHVREMYCRIGERVARFAETRDR